jgi:uncharacterized protein (TIGR03083 family)
MSELIDQSIAELRANQERLRAVVEGLTEDQLQARSGAESWTVADVLSHLGSGAELQWYQVAAAVGDDSERPENQSVWDRWNAMSPQEQASSFVAADERLVSFYEQLTAEQRSSITVDLGFLPAPVPLDTPLAMRLSEQTLHGWDARVGVDPTAVLTDEAARLLLQHHVESMSFLLGFAGKADAVAEPVRLAVDDYTLIVDDSVRMERGADDTTATYAGPLEAFVRLLAGRLDPERTPDGVEVTGNVSLDDLRKVFPGY